MTHAVLCRGGFTGSEKKMGRVGSLFPLEKDHMSEGGQHVYAGQSRVYRKGALQVSQQGNQRGRLSSQNSAEKRKGGENVVKKSRST